MSNELWIAIAIAGAYLTGSISTAVWVGRGFFGLDVRAHGSRNAGATNTLRVLGLKAGIPVLLLDVFKGWLPVFLIRYLPITFESNEMLEIVKIACGLSAVAGHVFPVYTRFRGGKGVATLLGMGLALFPYPSLAAVIVFALMMLLFRIVSLSSVTAAIVFPFATAFLPFGDTPGWPLLALSVFVALFIPYTHRENIRRLLKGEEKKFTVARK